MLQPTLASLNTLFAHALTQEPARAGPDWQVRDFHPVSGGDISHAFMLYTDGPSFFVKLNDSAMLTQFQAEAHGLQAIADSGTIGTCAPLCCGHFKNHSYLILEGLQLERQGEWYQAGQQLAAMHKRPAGRRYGFDQPSYCGTTYQPNDWHDNWAEFFAEQRIGHQLTLLNCHQKNHPDIQAIIDSVRHRLHDHQPTPALVHGDLWSGNIGFHNQQPVIFDPATYVGDPETDLAMSELFGAFPKPFYQGYDSVLPIDPDYPRRRPLYQLYHLINHANLFGGHYLEQVRQQLRQLMN
ncbi:fructosamine kinase family protein [Pseudomaricurvus alkylphenolicus]|uniref:fructosamine kinase family protein n=1 Tax=Pseudomaricurvus alkylphenolicus TaxID=1306991 RepID=UPI00141E6727|nr:fructosamine kinase family protein [Pseudomaricurvus alkylphenolicus]NIB41828.1 fructosamine kinase family protein [Pseudomaricurvus alkylphenolicus]